jgi:hypothetical protein
LRGEKAKTPAGWTFTVLLQETAGVGIEFQTVQAAYPLPPTGHGLEWHGGIRDWPFFRRLDANSEIRATFSPTFLMRVPDYADLEFRGIGDDFKAIRVPIRVYLR